MKAGCKLHHCDKPARSNQFDALCDGHYRQKLRTGQTTIFKARPQGPACGICGRSVYTHGVTEWCHVETRMVQGATAQRIGKLQAG